MREDIFQIVYAASEDDENLVHPLFADEAEAMKKANISIGTKPFVQSKRIMYRGTLSTVKSDYPADARLLHNYAIYSNYLFLSKYYPYIEDMTIETFFADDLDDDVEKLIQQRGWAKAFIKREITALEHIEIGKSIWPETSFDEMKRLYKKLKVEGAYAIRRYLQPDYFSKELRYWVLNGRIYRRDKKIPKVVKEAASRLNKLGGCYYTIDATEDLIVEVNPGESSDRHAENSPELFAYWIRKEFDAS